jgi:hypothetical protein
VQQRRLHKENQPLEQLDRVIEEIREMMVRSAEEAVSKEKLNRGEPARAAGKKKKKQTTTTNRGAEDNSKEKFGIQEDFNRAGELMSRSS